VDVAGCARPGGPIGEDQRERAALLGGLDALAGPGEDR
jgi:hypothetical protein